MKGGSGGDTHFHTNIVMNGDGSSSGDNQKNATSMQRAIIATVRQEIVKQSQDGGTLAANNRQK